MFGIFVELTSACGYPDTQGPIVTFDEEYKANNYLEWMLKQPEFPGADKEAETFIMECTTPPHNVEVGVSWY